MVNMFSGCGCEQNSGLGYRTYAGDADNFGNTADKADDGAAAEFDPYAVVASVLDIRKGHIGTFQKLTDILQANGRSEPPYDTPERHLNAIEVTQVANFIRNADLFGAAKWMLLDAGYDFDPTPYIDEIVEKGVPGEFSIAALGGVWPLLAVAGLLMFSGGSKKKRGRGRQRARRK